MFRIFFSLNNGGDLIHEKKNVSPLLTPSHINYTFDGIFYEKFIGL